MRTSVAPAGTWLGVALWIACGCGGGGGADDPGRPDGDVLRFDAAMLRRAPDASAPIDASVSLDGGAPRDVGVPPRDGGGLRDTGGLPDAYRRTCTGTPWSCSTVGTSSCISQRGCRRDGECGGLARSCSSISYSSGCYGQDGCYWNSSTSRCGGVARSCYGYTGSSACIGQDGCDWDDTCEGVATSCSLLGEFECELQRGCYLR